MAIGFDTGAKWLDRYYEAYYDVIECYYDNLGKNSYYNSKDYFDQYILPGAKQVARSTKGLYKGSYYDSYYEDLYKNYFSSNSWDTIWAGYGYGGCNVDKILRRWGFSGKKISSSGGGSKGGKNEYDTITPPKKYHK